MSPRAWTAGSVFSGIGMLDFGLTLAGFEHAWLCESDPWRRSILQTRWPEATIYEDIRDLHDPEPVDLIAGGFPCRGISSAGRQEGFGHPETALWREQLRVIRMVGPGYVLVENVAALLRLHGGECFNEVLTGLAQSGYECWWDVLPASAVGAPHRRDRIFLVGYSDALARKTSRPLRRGPGALVEHEAELRAERSDGFAPADSEDDGSERAGAPRERGAGPEDGGLGATDPDLGLLSARRDRGGADEDQEGPGPLTHPGLEGLEGAWPGRPAPDDAPPDPGGERRQQDPGGPPRDEGEDGRGPQADHQPSGAGEERTGPDFGDYTAAVERWEGLTRPAPEPLIRGVDARHAPGVVRSRLSALGDGVQVQLAELLGRMILEHAREQAKQRSQ